VAADWLHRALGVPCLEKTTFSGHGVP
jgi:hypothetical protein